MFGIFTLYRFQCGSKSKFQHTWENCHILRIQDFITLPFLCTNLIVLLRRIRFRSRNNMDLDCVNYELPSHWFGIHKLSVQLLQRETEHKSEHKQWTTRAGLRGRCECPIFAIEYQSTSVGIRLSCCSADEMTFHIQFGYKSHRNILWPLTQLPQAVWL